MIENVLFGILRIADTSHSFTKEEAIYRSSTKKGKGKSKVSDKGEVTVAFVNIAKSPSQEDFRKALAIRDLQERPVESKRKLYASVTIHNAHETHSCAQTETAVRKSTQKIITSEFEESNSQRQISISERDPNRWEKRKISKCTTV